MLSTTSTCSCSLRIAIGAESRLLSGSNSPSWGGTETATVYSPTPSGVQNIDSVVVERGGSRTCFCTAGPLLGLSSTTTTRSVGSDDSIVNGTRTAWPATPTLGRSRLLRSTSGSFVGLPTATVSTGTFASRSRWAASLGASPLFQSPSPTSTIACSWLNRSTALPSGAP